MSRLATATRVRRRLGTRRAVAGAGVLVLVAAGALAPALLGGPDELQRFQSRPDLRPPQIVASRAPARGAGYVFLAPKNGPGHAGPMILDRRGRLVWFRGLPDGVQAFDFKPQRYRGRPVLTWWEGHSNKGLGPGVDVIADSSYRVIARLPMPPGERADLHEFELTPRGTALVPVYRRVPRDLRPYGGPARGKVIECLIEEIDVASGRVVWRWRSLDHVAVGESYKEYSDKPRGGYDYFHLNSIREEPGGRLLVSARHTNAVYEIDKRTGAVRWRLGGKRSSFALEPRARFVAQHDARRGPDGTVSVFDNEAPPDSERQSRVVILRLDRAGHTARLVREYRHAAAIRSDSGGSAQRLPGGEVFVGWGGKSPRFTEYAANGRVLFDARFRARAANSYRAFLLPWRGRPTGPPALAVRRHGDGATAYASWNGATDVVAWQLVGGPRPDALRPLAARDKVGFETAIELGRAPRFVAVRALGRGGAPLGASRAVRVR